MEIDKKQKLLNYLMPEHKVRQFLCNDLFLELKKLIPNSMCISPQNKSTEKRKKNYKEIKKIIIEFLDNNDYYKHEVEVYYKEEDKIDNLLIGYVFFVLNTMTKYNHVDIFLDKRSVCYSPISIIDFI